VLCHCGLFASAVLAMIAAMFFGLKESPWQPVPWLQWRR